MLHRDGSSIPRPENWQRIERERFSIYTVTVWNDVLINSIKLDINSVPTNWVNFYFAIHLFVYFYWKVQLNHSVVLMSAIQQSDSVTHIYFFMFFSIMVYHRILNIVLCAMPVGPCFIFFFNIYLSVLGLSCGMQDLSLWRVNSSCELSHSRAHGLSWPIACGILVPRPGIKPMSALGGRFLTTGPPGKYRILLF